MVCCRQQETSLIPSPYVAWSVADSRRPVSFPVRTLHDLMQMDGDQSHSQSLRCMVCCRQQETSLIPSLLSWHGLMRIAGDQSHSQSLMLHCLLQTAGDQSHSPSLRCMVCCRQQETSLIPSLYVAWSVADSRRPSSFPVFTLHDLMHVAGDQSLSRE